MKRRTAKPSNVIDSPISRSTPPGPTRAAMVRALPFGLFIAVLALRGMLGGEGAGAGMFDLRWLYVVQGGLALLAMLMLRRHYRELLALPRSLAGCLVSIAVGLAVFMLWIAPVPAWMHLGGSVAPFAPTDTQGALRWELVAARSAGAVLVVPLMEELFWRSFLMRWIDRREFPDLAPAAVSWFAILASSAVFALAHDLWLAAFLAGVLYALLFKRLGNLWYAVIAHGTTNLALAAWVVHERAWQYW